MDNLSLQEAKLVIPHNVQAQILGAIECIMKGDDKEQKIYLSRLARIVKTVASNYYLEEGYDSNYDRINRSPYTVVTRALDSCVKALQDSAFVVTENQLICSFRNCFDRNLRLDIQNLRNKNELTLDDLDFINTKKYISQFHQLNNSLLENKSIKSSEEKSYFFIPSKDKEDAEKLGAKWDRSVKYWYVPQGIDLTPFDKRWKRIDESTIELAKNEKQERDKLRKELKVEKDNQNQKITQSNSIDSAKKKGRSR